jgi:hypothetical protein
LNESDANSVFSDELICQHGKVPYTFVKNESECFVLQPLCKFCDGGFKRPTKAQIDEAKKALAEGVGLGGVPRGALILASQEHGLTLAHSNSNLVMFTRNKK